MLRQRLSMAVHESLAQRIVVRYHLGALEREELPVPGEFLYWREISNLAILLRWS